MREAFLGGVVAGYGIAVPVGAIALLIVGTGIRGGFVCAASAGAGAATADFLYAMTAAVSGAAVSRLMVPWQGAFRMAGGVALLAVALGGLVAGRRRREVVAASGSDRSCLFTYARFLGLSVVNPLTVVYYVSMSVGFASVAGGGLGHATVFAVGALAASLSWQTLLAVLGAAGGRGFSPRFRIGLSVVGNLVILALGARMLLTY